MACVADQGHARVGDTRGVVEAEWVARPGRGHRELAEEPAHALFRFGEECAVAELQHAGGVLRIDRPDDRGAVAVGIVGKREQRERAARIEYLVRDVLVRAFVMECADNRGVIIGPARDRDPGGLAGRRVAALRDDQQRGADGVARIEHGGDARFGAVDRRRARLHAEIDMRRGSGGIEQRATEQLVLVHRAERTIVRVGDEIELARLKPVADANLTDRAALPCQRRADADRVEHAVARAGHGRGAAVEARRQRHRGVRGIDYDRRDAVHVERHGERRADQPATEDEYVCVHKAAVSRQPVAANDDPDAA